jgi:hypothetical protein
MTRIKQILIILSFACFLAGTAAYDLGFDRYPPGVRNADGSVSRHTADDVWRCAQIRIAASFGDPYSNKLWRICAAGMRAVGTLGGFDVRYWSFVGAIGAGSLFMIAFAVAIRLERPPARIIRGRRYLTGGAARSRLAAVSRAERRRFGKGFEFPPGIAMSRERETRHFLIWGSVGAGKTQAMLHLMLAALNRGDKILVLDTKGDMTASLPGEPVLIAPQDARSSVWSVADDCRTKQDARELAARLIPASADPMWSDAAREILVACIAHLQRSKGAAWSWSDLREIAAKDGAALFEIATRAHPEAMRLLADPQSRTTQSVLATLSAHMNVVGALADAWPDGRRDDPDGRNGAADEDQSFPAGPLPPLTAPNARERNEASGASADAGLAALAETGNADATRARFSIVSWLSAEGHAPPLILQRDGKYPELSNAWIGGLLGLLASAVGSPSLGESSSRRLWLFLDEFPQLPRMSEFTTFLDVGRSKGVVVVLAAQDIAQIRAIYGRERADSWIGLVGTQIIARLNPGRGAEEASLMIGEQETEKRVRSVTTLGRGRTVTESLHREMRRVVTASELSSRLGPTQRGVRVLILGPGADIYEIELPFVSLPPLRPPSIPSAWTHRRPPNCAAAAPLSTKERPHALSRDEAARIRDLGR